MKITVRVKPNATRNSVEKQDDGSYIVRVTAPAVEGKANEKLVETLAEYFGKPKRSVTIVRGASAKIKIVEIF